jgi:phospholipid-transporting ATPase
MYYGLTAVYGESIMRADGLNSNNWVMGEMIYTADLIVITLKAALVVDTWVKFTFFAIMGSIGLWFALFPLYAWVGPMIGVGSELHGVGPIMFSSSAFWFAIVLIPMAANLRDYTWKQ